MSTCCQTGTCAICTSPEAIAAREESKRLIAALKLPKPPTEAEQVERVMQLGKRGLLAGGQHEIRVRGGAR